jgi:ABC-type maltose transport system permease subunit
MARFSHRPTRLARQRECETFRQILMPLSTLLGFIGLLGMVLVGLDHHLNQRWEATAFSASAIAAALPVFLFLYRWMRGHFNRQLQHP